jgi:hypothetical protein
MKKFSPLVLAAIFALGVSWSTAPLRAQAATAAVTGTNAVADPGASGGNNVTPTHNVNNTSGGNPNGGQIAPGVTSSGATTHVNTAAGMTPGDGNSGVTSTPPSGVTPGTGASPNPH